MNTISVDIKEQDLINLSVVSETLTSNKEVNESLFKLYPFTLYRKRMLGESFLTIQIPLNNFFLFLDGGLVK